MKDATKGTLFAIASALVFGITPVFASLSFDLGSNALTLTFYRNAMAIPVLLVMLILRRVSLKITLKEFVAVSLISILLNVTTTYILYASYDYIGIGLATTLHFLYPVFTVLFGRIFFKHKLGKVKGIALILATFGIAISTGDNTSVAITGIILAVASAVTYAAYLIGIEKSVIKNMDSTKAMFYMCIINSLAVCIFDLPSGNIVYALGTKAMIYTLIVSIANSAFAYILLILSIKLIGAGDAAIYSMLEPVSGVAAGIVFLSETLPVLKLISCIIILIAVTIPILDDRRKTRLNDPVH